MSILNYLPEFKVLEPNRLTGLTAGHVLAQFPGAETIAVKDVNGNKFVENGIIVGLGKDLEIENYKATDHAQPFVVFNEELNTFLSGLKYYAEPVNDGEVYPRAIGLYVGDTFTTNNYVDVDVEEGKGDYATVVNGVLTLGEDGIFKAEKATLPTGEDAYKFTFIGEVTE